MAEQSKSKQQTLAGLPPEWKTDLMPQIRDHMDGDDTKIVILDDDPTGTQTVHGIPVLTTWDPIDLEVELKSSAKAFFLLTNSRGYARQGAITLAREIGTRLKAAARAAGKEIIVISRSDSTLRGHFPHEVDETALALGLEGLPYLICPFFLEGERYTIGNIHYVAEKETLIPAAQTAYARDAAFGFSTSDLCRWVEEKTCGRIPAGKVAAVSLADIRDHGPDQVADILSGVSQGGACIVNAASYRDIEVLILALLNAEKKGARFLFRTAASFVRIRCGITPGYGLLEKDELISGGSAGGLFVVGSYVPKTTAQVNALIRDTDVLPLAVSVEKLLDARLRDDEISRVTREANRALADKKDTLVYTSRDLVSGTGPEESLKIGQAVSAGLISIVKALECQPGYLVAKGGITSSDVATDALNVKRAMVSGQALPGIPVWKLGEDAIFPGMSYIIFPGNVGDDDALVTIQKKLGR